MTSSFRLIISGLAAVLALFMGWTATGTHGGSVAQAQPRPIASVSSLSVEDTDSLVEAILASNLFERVRTREELESGIVADNADALETALGNPELSAVASFDGEWRILLYGDFEGTVSRFVGDQLSDGWSISVISPSLVSLDRDGETRSIDLFEQEPEPDES